MCDFFCTQKDLLLPEEGGREENGSMRYFCYIGYQTKTVDNQTRLVGLCIQKWNLRGGKIAESCLTLRGVEMIWSHSSVESTWVPWRTKQPDCIRQLHIAPVSDVTCNQSLVLCVNIYESAI